ncbi:MULTISPECIES: porin [Pseudomonadota]|uniref:Porin n=1 Tax=Stutzerimonas stutzeri TaxID=316 RepID=A0A2N8SZB2_STUST|nr:MULTISPECIES: porin [Pseudomonadota]KWT88529.1 Outer membrane protein (porin) [Variovorax sp. WDL1]MCQ4249797.1 porin [Stutzerimonas stutzeri]PNG07817.1 porin [Stutzerimonas stutzeri]PNG59709.1 Outer membrane porin protein 32 [Variovorax sp. B4]PNG60500.1 Outer membrane porin protein 32 [Variovorax sp. B2]
MKKIIAGACCIASLSANAQSTVTITGVVDAYAGRIRMAGDLGSISGVNGGGLTTSWFGFLVGEDLGGGVRATVKLNAFFRPDVGSTGRFDNDPYFSRDANIALSGRFGAVTLGRSQAPNMEPSIVSNPFAGSFTFSPLILHSNVNTTAWPRRTTPADTGWSNQIVYTTPTAGGFRASLHYQFGEQLSGTPGEGSKNVGATAFYTKGPLNLAAYYERDQISNPVNPAPITTNIRGVNVLTTKTVWMVGGSYDFGVLKAYGSYGRSRWDVLDYESRTMSAGVSIPVGAGSVLAAVARTKVSGPVASTRTTASVGYDYFLSKRTDVYAVVLRDAVTALRSGTSVGLGIRHRF